MQKDKIKRTKVLELLNEGYLWIFGKLLNREDLEVTQDQLMLFKTYL
ncbi:hypothetical protein [Wukongibacter sp. M2B1]